MTRMSSTVAKQHVVVVGCGRRERQRRGGALRWLCVWQSTLCCWAAEVRQRWQMALIKCAKSFVVQQRQQHPRAHHKAHTSFWWLLVCTPFEPQKHKNKFKHWQKEQKPRRKKQRNDSAVVSKKKVVKMDELQALPTTNTNKQPTGLEQKEQEH